jgi:hypothetical protein
LRHHPLSTGPHEAHRSGFRYAVGITASLENTVANFDSNLAPGSIIQFEYLTSEDGLSQNAGLAIFQDCKGYLWVGTQDGLNR